MPFLRQATLDDHDRLVSLWADSGIAIPDVDSRAELAAKLERDPQLFLVLELGGTLVGSVMGSYDGRRGWIGRLCVRPEGRERGHASRLLEAVEHELRSISCQKVKLLVEPGNSRAFDFYAARGFGRDDLVFMEKWL